MSEADNQWYAIIPSVDDVREAYIERQESADWPTQRSYEEWRDAGGGEVEFARFLAEFEADVLERAANDLTPGDDKVDDWGIQAGLLRDRARAVRVAAGFVVESSDMPGFEGTREALDALTIKPGGDEK